MLGDVFESNHIVAKYELHFNIAMTYRLIFMTY